MIPFLCLQVAELRLFSLAESRVDIPVVLVSVARSVPDASSVAGWGSDLPCSLCCELHM